MAGQSSLSEEAVSPVIGVILMVAITVVVATVIFVLVRGFDTGDAPAPMVQFLRNNQNGELTVIRTTEGIDVSAIDIRISVDGYFSFNGPASTSATEALASTFVPVSGSPGTPLRPGDSFAFCVSGSTAANIQVDVRVTSPPDVVVFQNSLTGVRSC